MFKCIIIDDQDYAIEGVQRYIQQISGLEVIGSYNEPLRALREISAGDQVDLIFMDIDMPNISGLELASAIRSKTNKLVFTTSHTKYGYDAFQVDADGYLLKPYSFAKFAALIAKLFPEPKGPLRHENGNEDFFFVKDKNDDLKMVKIRFQDVIAIESQQNYVMVHSLQKKVLTYMSLTEIGKSFRSMSNFVQFQRSFILNKDHIDLINGHMIKMVNGTHITVGEHYKKDFVAFLDRNLLKAKRKI